MLCYCGTGIEFDQCCGPLLRDERQAETPEQLMRSRYSAFCVKDFDYLENTTDPQLLNKIDLQANKDWAQNSQFIHLEVLNSTNEGNKGTVEFKAHYKTSEGETVIHHEFSKFRKHGGQWYFRDGRVKE